LNDHSRLKRDDHSFQHRTQSSTVQILGRGASAKHAIHHAEDMRHAPSGHHLYILAEFIFAYLGEQSRVRLTQIRGDRSTEFGIDAGWSRF